MKKDTELARCCWNEFCKREISSEMGEDEWMDDEMVWKMVEHNWSGCYIPPALRCFFAKTPCIYVGISKIVITSYLEQWPGECTLVLKRFLFFTWGLVHSSLLSTVSQGIAKYFVKFAVNSYRWSAQWKILCVMCVWCFVITLLNNFFINSCSFIIRYYFHNYYYKIQLLIPL